MKNIIKLFTFPLLTIIGFNSCASIPLKIGESENNSTYTVSYLFEHDGCKVYRFYDKEEFYKLKYCSTVVYMVPRA